MLALVAVAFTVFAAVFAAAIAGAGAYGGEKLTGNAGQLTV